MSLSDVVIIGGGLSGQLMGWLLAKQGYSVTLCEQEKELGGRCRVDVHHESSIDYGLHFNLITPKLAATLELNVDWIRVENKSPLHFRQKEWHPISEEALTPEQRRFCHRDFILPKGGMKSVFEPVQGFSGVDVLLAQPIIGSVIKNSLIQKVQSGDQSWGAKAFVFAVPMTSLMRCVDSSQLHPKFLKAVKKQSFMSAVKLDFVLKDKLTDVSNILIDMDNNGLGYFPTVADPSLSAQHISQWLFFLSPEELADKEAIAKKIRAGKRTIKKAFPQFFDAVVWERIGVIPSLAPAHSIPDPRHTGDVKEWTKIHNLFWVSDHFSGNVFKGDTLLQAVKQVTAYLENSQL